MTMFNKDDRVRINGANDTLEGTVTGDHDTMFQHMVGVRWDGNDFAFVDPARLVHIDAIPGLAESDRRALAAAMRVAGDAIRSEPEPPAGLYVEILARMIDGEHLDRIVSTEWRGCWCRPVRLKGYESTRDVNGRVLQQTLRFADGTTYTSHNPHLKVRVWV